MSSVSIVREDQLTFHATHGLALDGAPRTGSFCAHAIQDPGRVFVVRDAEDDERFHQNPLVHDHDVRFYAGAPLIVGDDRTPLGTLCVLDEDPRDLQDHHVQGLKALAAQAARKLERAATIQPPAVPDPGPLPLQECTLRGPLFRLGRALDILEHHHRGDEATEDVLASAWDQMRCLHRTLDALDLLVEPEDTARRVHLDAILDEVADALDDEAPSTKIVAPELPRPPGSQVALKTLLAALVEVATEPDPSVPHKVTVDGDKTAPGWRFTVEAHPHEGERDTRNDERIEQSLKGSLATLPGPLDARLVLSRLIVHAHGGELELADASPGRIRFLFTLDPRPRHRDRWKLP